VVVVVASGAVVIVRWVVVVVVVAGAVSSTAQDVKRNGTAMATANNENMVFISWIRIRAVAQTSPTDSGYLLRAIRFATERGADGLLGRADRTNFQFGLADQPIAALFEPAVTSANQRVTDYLEHFHLRPPDATLDALDHEPRADMFGVTLVFAANGAL
jgi:hypothetical protein